MNFAVGKVSELRRALTLPPQSQTERRRERERQREREREREVFCVWAYINKLKLI